MKNARINTPLGHDLILASLSSQRALTLADASRALAEAGLDAERVLHTLAQRMGETLDCGVVVDDEVSSFWRGEDRPHGDFGTATVLADGLKGDFGVNAGGVISIAGAERIAESRWLIDFEVVDATAIVTTIGAVHRVTP